MNCPPCGMNLQGVTSATCPRCGQPITAANLYGQPPAGYPSAPPGYNAPGAMGYEQPSYGQPSGYGQPAGFGQPAGYGMPVPPPPAPKRRASRGVVRLVSIVFVVACVGILVVVGALGNKVSQTPLPGVTATVTGKLVYRQSFTSSADSMPTDNNCKFADGGYEMQNDQNCYPDLSDQTNATVTVQVKQISGDASGAYGIAFRRASKGNNYLFLVDNAGDWSALKCANSNCANLTAPGQSDAIQKGMNTVNTLQVHMDGSHFDFYVNGAKVGSADDSTFAKGKVGLTCLSPAVAVFNNMELTNP